MANKKKADQQASPKEMRLHDTSGHAQRIRLLEWMRPHGAINTFDAIWLLDNSRPGARIAKLRAAGHDIITLLGQFCDDQGSKYQNMVTYCLSADPVERVAECTVRPGGKHE